MQIRDARVLLLGGSGLVGMAVARQLLPLGPAKIVISALTRAEAEGAVDELRADPAAAGVELVAEWGDVFVAEPLKDRRRAELLGDPEARALLLDDLYTASLEETLGRSALGRLIERHRPDVVVDSINTATVFAYQNVYQSVAELRAAAEQGSADSDTVERHLSTLYLPQLSRHVQIALEAMRCAETRSYVKIGTAGSGGMGLNVPFTHSEERPSRMLLAKSSIAGAHTLLLFLMARTPGAPAVKEIKPAAAISWKRIAFGEVTRRGQPIRRIDADRALPLAEAFAPRSNGAPWHETGEALRGVYVDAGENGHSSPGEFETLTALGLMEFITPEEIARDVVREITGHATGHDVVAALDGAVAGPTYRAGVLRQSALERMQRLEAEHEVESVAYEMLGPPRLAKLLFEAAILARLAEGDLERAAALDPEDAARRAAELVQGDAELRSRMLSIGLPVLMPCGTELLRGAEVRVPPEPGRPLDVDRTAERGWVDLRAANWAHWQERARKIVEECARPGAEAGSWRDLESWEHSRTIRPGALAAWVFRYEDAGERIKR
jgi:hypothetical protein